MYDDDGARRLARVWGLTSVLIAGVAAQPAIAWADDASPASPRSGEFVETPVGPAAGGLAPPPSPVATPANSGELVEQPADAVTTTAAPTSPTSSGPFGFLSTASRSSNLLGDMWGLRPFLSKYGMTLSVVENSELFGNVSGGVRQGFEYNGLTTATLQIGHPARLRPERRPVQRQRLADPRRQSQRRRTSTRLQTASGIEADRATRLWELWYQQKFGDAFDVKIGQQSLDQEFMVSQNAGYFVNTMFGWPMLPSADLPGGGPAYPLSALGVRARAHVTDTVTRSGRRLQRQPGRPTTPAIRRCSNPTA